MHTKPPLNIVPAQPGYFGVRRDSDTGELTKGLEVLAWHFVLEQISREKDFVAIYGLGLDCTFEEESNFYGYLTPDGKVVSPMSHEYSNWATACVFSRQDAVDDAAKKLAETEKLAARAKEEAEQAGSDTPPTV